MSVITAFGGDHAEFGRRLRLGGTAIAEQNDDGPRFRARVPSFDVAAAVPEQLRHAATTACRRSPPGVQAGLVVAVRAWMSAGLHTMAVPAERVGLVVAGGDLDGAHAHAVQATSDPLHVPPRYALQMLATDQVGVISQVLEIRGAGLTVSVASAGGNAAVITAATLLAAGELDACLVLGALARPSPTQLRALANLGALAWDRLSVPFDRSHCGFVLGEAAACLVLETGSSALRRGAGAAVALAGYAQGLDGNALADPSASGEAAVMEIALLRAGVRADEVEYVNAHGTGAQLGDVTEAEAIRTVFGSGGPWVNSTKSLVGHCLGSAGVVEAIATVTQMTGGFLHSNAGLTDPITSGCRFVGDRPVRARVRVALSNGFAFGGVNTSLVFRAPDRS